MVVGYLRRRLVFESVRAKRSLMGKPFSAMSIAGCSTCAKVIVPQRSSSVYQASTTPGTVPESSVSSTGILPCWFCLYHSMVASLGAVPSALSEHAPALRVVDQHHGVAADAVGRRVDDAEHGLPGDDRVEGVAARAQNPFGGLARFGLHRGHRVMRAPHHGAHGLPRGL